MARIFALASEVLEGDDSAKKWLHRNQFSLVGGIPLGDDKD